MEGRLLLAGVDPGLLSARQWLAITYAVVADQVDGLVDRAKVLANLEQELTKPAFVTRDRWGTTPDAQAGQAAMMAMTGGPASMRDPAKPRPAAWRGRTHDTPVPTGEPPLP